MNSKLISAIATLQFSYAQTNEWECPELLCEKDWEDATETRLDPNKDEGQFFTPDKKNKEIV